MVEGLERGIRESKRPEDRKLANDYLAALAPLLASAVLGKDILRQLPIVERLLGHTWLIDDAPFCEALSRWRLFRRNRTAASEKGSLQMNVANLFADLG